MPELSRFYGISILMNFLDHAPPHFHAWYNEYKVTISIKDGVVKGEMPGRALKLVLDWLEVHRLEILEAWKNASVGKHFSKIEPLK